MPRASRKPISKSLDKEIKNTFAFLISSLNKSPQINPFFNEFLTHEEQIMLSKRIVIHLLLEKGYENNQIQASLGVNKDTVRIHRLVWQNASPEYKTILKTLVRRDNIKDFLNKLDSFLKPLDLAIKSRNDMRARAKFASGDFN
jgi:uncharacterized protein YerC